MADWIVERLTDDEMRVLRLGLELVQKQKLDHSTPRTREVARDLDTRLMRAKRVTVQDVTL